MATNAYAEGFGSPRAPYRVFCGTNTRFVGIVPITEQPIPSLVTEKARDLAKFY